MNNYDPNPQASEAPLPPEPKELRCIKGCCVLVSKQGIIKKEKKEKKKKQRPTTPIVGQFKCAAEGYEIHCVGFERNAHIVTQQIRKLKSDHMNILKLCQAHEKHFNNKPLKDWYRYVRKHWPQHFEYVFKQVQFVYDQVNEYLDVAKEVGYKRIENPEEKKIKPSSNCLCECHDRWTDYPLTTHCIECMKNHPFKQII